jgi:deoxyribonuclease V
VDTWPDTIEALAALQQELSLLRPEPWTPSAGRAPVIGGCIVCFPRGDGGHGNAGDAGWAAAVLWRDGELLATSLARGAGGAEYAAGYLALREGPLLAAAVRGLPARPDVLLANGTGADHPRGFGMATHLGWALELPTVGVTHRPLFATGGEPGPDRGAASPLILDGREVGVMLRTRAGARSLAVTAGWRTDVATAVEVVLMASRGIRTPEPFRHARQAAREFRNRSRV